MEKNTKTTGRPVDELRAAADRAIEAWRAAEANAILARDRFAEVRSAKERAKKPGHGAPTELHIAELDGEARKLEAEDAASIARLAATEALDAADAARGEVACDFGMLHAEVAAIVAEEDGLRAALADAAQRRVARVRTAIAAWVDLVQRREAGGLPPPRSFPADNLPLVDWVDALVAPPNPPKLHHEKIAMLRHEETRLRADLERTHLEREKEEADRAKDQRVYEDERARFAKDQEQRWAEQAAAAEAHARETEQLAAAHKARTQI